MKTDSNFHNKEYEAYAFASNNSFKKQIQENEDPTLFKDIFNSIDKAMEPIIIEEEKINQSQFKNKNNNHLGYEDIKYEIPKIINNIPTYSKQSSDDVSKYSVSISSNATPSAFISSQYKSNVSDFSIGIFKIE